MKLAQKQFKKMTGCFGSFGLWILFCGIDRKGSKPNFSVTDLETTNLLQSMPPPSTWPLSFWLALFVLVFGTAGGIYGIRYLREKQAQEELDAIVDEQALLGLETELENKRVEEEGRDFLEEMCGTSDPVDLLPIVKSNEEFEQKVEEYKTSDRFREQGLQQIYDLRKNLEFTFRNPEFPFLRTQMIEKGTRLECYLRHKNRNVVFMTSVLDSNETDLFIKPPTVKRRPANLKQFPDLHCRIRRENDADYEFSLKIVDQMIDEMNAVVLRHTTHIRKMEIRESERVPMDMEMEFQLVTEAQYDLEQKFEAEKQDRETLSATIKDMSAGGMKLQMVQMPAQGINKGDVLVFHLPYASLRRNLAASVMNILPRGGLYDMHLKFRDNDTITRMKINQYLHRLTKSMEAMAS